MKLSKVFGTEFFVQKVEDKVQITLRNPQPTTAFIKGEGKRELHTAEISITVPVDVATYLYLAIKTIEDGFIPTFYQTEEGKRLIIAKGEGRREGYLGIRMIDYTKKEGGALWIPSGGHIKRARVLSVLRIVLNEFPILLYKEHDLNVVWQKADRRLVITDPTSEWVQLYNPINVALYKELVNLFDKTRELPTLIDFVPGVEKREFRMLGIDEEGNFTVMGRVYPLSAFKRIGYLMEF